MCVSRTLAVCVALVAGSCASVQARDLLIVLGGELGSPADVQRVVNALSGDSQIVVRKIDHRSSRGVAECVKSLREQMQDIKCAEYDRVHFYAFILGGIVLREYLSHHQIPNLGRVVLDRSPYEEPVPVLSQRCYPLWVIRLLHGRVVEDIARIRYRDLPMEPSRIGLLIETRPNSIAKTVQRVLTDRHRGGARLFLRTVFHPDSLIDGCGDYQYLPYFHEQMYQTAHTYRASVLAFLRHGRFPDEVDRSWRDRVVAFYPDTTGAR